MAMSTREEDGKIKIIKLRCERCGHHKAWNKPRAIICTKCHYETSHFRNGKRG